MELEDKKLLKVKEICDTYGLSRKIVDKAINGGQLKSYQVNAKERRCKSKDVDKWIETLAYVPNTNFDFAVLGVKNVRLR